MVKCPSRRNIAACSLVASSVLAYYWLCLAVLLHDRLCIPLPSPALPFHSPCPSPLSFPLYGPSLPRLASIRLASLCLASPRLGLPPCPAWPPVLLHRQVPDGRRHQLVQVRQDAAAGVRDRDVSKCRYSYVCIVCYMRLNRVRAVSRLSCGLPRDEKNSCGECAYIEARRQRHPNGTLTRPKVPSWSVAIFIVERSFAG